jgi:ATP-binding cassette subfamily C protein CydD
VVLLDEPTSALDSETEARVMQGVRALADDGRLVIIVTHRRTVMAAADAVLALESTPEPAPLEVAEAAR